MAEAYQNIDDQTLDLIKYPPLYPPEVEYISDYDYSSNNLRGKQFQFCYRYKYMGNMKSVFSPYSEVLIPQGEELPNGDFTPDFHLNNGISIKIDLGHHTVDSVEVAYRIGNNGNLYVHEIIKKHSSQYITGKIHKGNNVLDEISSFGGILIKDIKVGMIIRTSRPELADSGLNGMYVISVDAENNRVYLSGIPVPPFFNPTGWTLTNDSASIDDQYIYSIFRNDKVDYAVSTEESIESFDRVPLSAKSFEVIESNRIVLGGPKLGFDNVDDMEITNEVLIQEKADMLNKYDINEFYTLTESEIHLLVKIPDSLTFGDYIYFNFRFRRKSDNVYIPVVVSYYYGEGNTDTLAEITAYIIDKINESNSISGDPNFRCWNLNEYWGLHGLEYSGSASYIPGAVVRYNNKIYGCLVGGSGKTPGASTSISYWQYICDWDDRLETMVLWSLPIGSSKTTYLYELESYGLTIYKSLSVYSKFKDGVPVNLAIEYFDYAGRLGAANHDSQLEINIPRLDEVDSSLYTFNNLTNSIKLTVAHKPPEWATGWRVLMDRNVPWFQQFFFYGPAHANPDLTDDNIHWRINVNRAIQNLRDYFPKSVVVPYIFEKGDRIRMIAYQLSDDVNAVDNQWRKYNVLIDSEIIGYDYEETVETYLKDDDGENIKDSNGNKVRDVSTGFILVEKRSVNDEEIKYIDDGHTKRKYVNSLNDAVYIVYEIYRPKKSTDENTFLYETHRTFAVGLPGEPQRYHSDPDLPFSTLQAEITLTSGNVYRKMRYSGEADIYFPVESMHASDYYESDSISIGRTNVISKDLGQIEEENGLVTSGVVIEDTAINQLNKFPSANHWRLQSKHGTINALLEKGFILYAFQDIKVTSIYVGRNSMIDPADGSERVTLDSKAIFGTMRPDMSSEFGCADPKSICNSVSHVYFWDRNKSKWCRAAYNGIFPISDYGKRKHFTDINALMGLTSNKHSISAYDIRYDELVISQKYIATDDYNIQFRALYTVGDNKFTNVGREDATDINIFEVGMIVTDMVTSYDTPEINLTIVKIDTRNRILYLDGVIPFATGVTGAITVDANVYKKHQMSTLAFHEAANAWKTQFPFYPELMVSYGDKLLSFIHGRTYLHHEGNYGEFYGTTFEQFIQFAFNPGMVALFNGIELTADHAFGMVEKGDVTVLSDDMFGEDMESKLPSVRLRNVEGKYVASFLRDQNTPGSQTDVYKLVNGRFLRGQTIVLKMTNFEEEKVILFDVGLYFTQSL